jgi:8-oxo-dGTP pyrophosphatase MutT (NUDIX family)
MAEIRKVAWLEVRDRKLLCIRRRGGRQFYLPGGAPEAGEQDIDALQRQIEAQLAVKFVASTLIPVGTISAPSDEDGAVIVTITAFTGLHEGIPRPHGDITEVRLIGIADAARTSTLTQRFIASLEIDHVID